MEQRSARDVVGYANECLEREAMQLQEQMDLFTLPVELYAGGKAVWPRLRDRVRTLLDVQKPDYSDAERKYEREATKAAMDAYESGDKHRGDRILARYAEQAKKRAAEYGVDGLNETRLEGDVRSLRMAINQGRI